jgi:hypothetical protein
VRCMDRRLRLAEADKTEPEEEEEEVGGAWVDDEDEEEGEVGRSEGEGALVEVVVEKEEPFGVEEAEEDDVGRKDELVDEAEDDLGILKIWIVSLSLLTANNVLIKLKLIEKILAL